MVLVPAWRPWRRPVHAGRRAWALPLLCGVAVAIAFWLIEGVPRWPAQERWQWIVFLALFAGAAGALAAFMRHWWLFPIPAAGAAAIAHWLTRPPGSDEELLWWKLLVAAASFAFCLALEPLARRRSGWLMSLACTAMCASAAGVILLSGHEKLARLEGAMAAVLLVAFALCTWQRRLTLGYGPLLAAGPITIAILLLARVYSYSDVPVICYVLPVAAPLLLWIGEIPKLRKRPWLGEIVRVLLTLLPMGAAVFMASRFTDLSAY